MTILIQPIIPRLIKLHIEIENHPSHNDPHFHVRQTTSISNNKKPQESELNSLPPNTIPRPETEWLHRVLAIICKSRIPHMSLWNELLRVCEILRRVAG